MTLNEYQKKALETAQYRREYNIIYPTKEEAKKSSVVGFDYVDTVKIEWEE